MSAGGMGCLESLIERDRRVRWERRRKSVYLCMLFLAVGVASAIGGGFMGYKLGFQEAMRLEAEKPKPKPVYAPAAIVQMSRTECARACFSRERMERVR